MCEGVVGHLIGHAALVQLARQPVVPIEVNLQAAGQPCRHPHVAQAQFFVHEIEIVMQAFLPSSGTRYVLPVCLLCHGLYVEQGSIAEKMHTRPACSPRFAMISFTRSSFRKFRLRMNSISTPPFAAICSAFSRIRFRYGSANFG